MGSYLVTGGAGFIGSHLVRALLEQGEKVKVLDNLTTGKKANIQEVLDDVEWIEGDLTDEMAVKKAVEKVDVIFHQGALPSVPKSLKAPLKTNKSNVTGTLLLLETARRKNVRRLVYAASSSAYGDHEQLPKHEAMPANPISPYAISKFVGELYCNVYYRTFGLETISLRYFNVFGPKQDPHSEYAAVIPKFIQKMLNDEQPYIYGDGEQSRDFTYIDNVVSANLLAAKAPKLSGEVINIGSNNRITLNQLVRTINDELNKNIEPIYIDSRQGDVKHSLASIERANQLIGYRPLVTFEEGLKKTIRFFQESQ